MTKKTLLPVLGVLMLLALLGQAFPASSALAAGATSSVHVVKYAADGVTVVDEQTVSYQWMEDNLPKCGDGVTHYYLQGPTFDPNNLWDENETVDLSLKDKGAVMGTNVADLCDLVGGMVPGDEVLMHAADNWTIKFKYANVYEPQDRQGIIALCWYNGEEAKQGEKYGIGYPGNVKGYRTALQIVIMAKTTNSEGEYIFGNADMQATMPAEEGYSHFFEGIWPSTNGLSGKWIDGIFIYPTGTAPEIPESDEHAAPTDSPTKVPWLAIGLGSAGLLLVGVAVYFVVRKKDLPSSPTGGV